MAGDQAARRTSEWPLTAELERAARYVRDVRTAPTRGAQLRAASSVEGVAALRAVLRGLPRLGLAFSDAPIGQEMRGWFRPDRRLPFNRAPIAALQLPATVEEYLRGRSRQALRTNLKRLAAEGMTSAPITDERELRLVAEHLAVKRRVGVGIMVRSELVPRPGRWWAATYDSAGDPVGLNETVVDGVHAGLVLMIHEPGHPAALLLRYGLHVDVVGRLIDRGVRTLTVGGSMLLESQGTHYFQQRTGFTPVRVDVLPPRHEAAAPARLLVQRIEPRTSADGCPRTPTAVG